MLTISHDQKYTLSIQTKESFWSKTLLLALGCAMLIHGTGLILFKVKPFACRQCQIILDPISVAMETPAHIQQELIAELDEPSISPSLIPPKPQKKPTVPLASLTAPLPTGTFKLSPKKYPLPLPAPKTKSTAYIRLLGTLASRQITETPDEIELTASPVCHHYHVTVDNRSGQIMWIDPLDDISQALLNITFYPQDGDILTRGELEVLIR